MPTAAANLKNPIVKPDNLSSLKALFPNASLSFLKLHGIVQDDESPVAPALCYPKPQQDARKKPLDSDQAEKGGTGSSSACITVIITRYGPKLLDVDNLAGGCKPLIDALRYEGVIPNDDPGTIELVFRQFKAPKDEQGTSVIIGPAS